MFGDPRRDVLARIADVIAEGEDATPEGQRATLQALLFASASAFLATRGIPYSDEVAHALASDAFEAMRRRAHGQ